MIDWPLQKSFFIALLAIANPLGKLPVWTAATRDEDGAVRRWLALLIVVTGASVLVSALFFGRELLSFFNVELAAFRIGGGVVLLRLGLSMLDGKTADLPSSEGADGAPLDEARSRFRQLVVPLAIPLIAGPGAILTALIYGSRASTLPDRAAMAGTVLIVCAVLFTMFLGAKRLTGLVGDTMLEVQTRLFGLLLTAIAAQLMIEGLGSVFPNWVESFEIQSDILDELREHEAEGNQSGK